MRYVSKPTEPTECEAMQWSGDAESEWHEDQAAAIIAWVDVNGGEARYNDNRGLPGSEGLPDSLRGPNIAVRTINGWAYAEPGHYVVMGTALFEVDHTAERGFKHLTCVSTVRDFYPCDPETFESRWEPVDD